MKANVRGIIGIICISLLLSTRAQSVLALPTNMDTDGDGIPDMEEDANGNGIVDLGETNPYKADTDEGGESDGTEIKAKRNPLDPTDDLTYDSDGDGWVNGIELLNNTNPNNPDTDGDGVNDPEDAFPLDSKYSIDTNANHLPDEWEVKTGLENEQVAAMTTDDPDQDGLTNAEELARGTNPINADTDRDGVDDATEINQGTDPKENACLELSDEKPTFADIPHHWSEMFVKELSRLHILPNKTFLVGGYTVDGNKYFAPDQPITRYEFLKMTILSTCTKLWNTADDSRPIFSDVRSTSVINENPDAAQKRRVIYSAVRYDVIDGYSDGTFKTESPINRAEALKILTLASQLTVFSDGNNLLTRPTFTDVAEHDWFFPYVKEMSIRGIVQGYDDGTFGPEKPITRAEAAKIIHQTILQNPLINGYILQ